MDLSFDWHHVLAFSISPLETMLRGTLMYWFLFLLFRFIGRRDVGSLGIADLLIIVIVADAAQNGMAGKGDSVADAALLVGTLVLWNRLLDLGAYLSPAIRRFVDPQPVMLVRNGRKLRANMARHAITDEELESQMRQEGVSSVEEVKAMYLEPGGKISVITNK
ncbi:DUF421 domain-containing protein [Cupriavidus agavae]|uniref:Uncharacterized protein DUF421 n=1 Tax=Cupriavidus agavae TaxID=1001822 RepID=A0A4Q7REY7_9BURK|nr:YetF domain-containing protein [Cupriavidus agavae]RZT31783.1 uncharacterized protein DUF421 [Cupriavidus agavae]